ncbi:helix-turn-helix domain-containing protein [Azohydromonas lata]|uniref:helix-turn-helix domain-containing protein n=1 Tax=Azohydromonas lata TaxID=45677 RepID=UPI00083711B4|nr:helix-turn-helix domain-containing protein [Azohydromonas lata]
MDADQGKHDKNVILHQHATLNPRPDGVMHPLFKGSEFFDPNDLLQVKYEMLRLVHIDKRPISEAAKTCGLSRPAFYQAQESFRQGGLAGLIAHKPGPHGAHKLLSPGLFHLVFPTQFCDAGRATSRIGPPGEAVWDGGVMRMGNEDGPGMPGRVAW